MLIWQKMLNHIHNSYKSFWVNRKVMFTNATYFFGVMEFPQSWCGNRVITNASPRHPAYCESTEGLWPITDAHCLKDVDQPWRTWVTLTVSWLIGSCRGLIDFEDFIFKLIIQNISLGSCCKIDLWWTLQNINNERSRLIQVMICYVFSLYLIIYTQQHGHTGMPRLLHVRK